MPTLKQLSCSVNSRHSKEAFGEFQPAYSDGAVTCYCLLPNEETEISVKLTSSGFISPGLAMFVFIDGIYQTNRNRRNLRFPSEGESMSSAEISFEVSQKESFKANGEMIGSSWVLVPLDQLSGDELQDGMRSLEDSHTISTIEVVVLRCFGDTLKNPLSAFGPSPIDDMLRKVPLDGYWQYHPYGDRRVLRGGPHEFSSADSSSNQFPHYRSGQPTYSQPLDAGSKNLPDGLSLNYDDLRTRPKRQVELFTCSGMFTQSSHGNVKIQNRLEDIHRAATMEENKPLYSHILLQGTPHSYGHTTITPRYIDGLNQPYAKFIFKYCNRETLERCIGERIDTSLEDAKAEFAAKSKEEVIAELVAQRKIAAGSRATSSRATIRDYNIDSRDQVIYQWKADGSTRSEASSPSNREFRKAIAEIWRENDARNNLEVDKTTSKHGSRSNAASHEVNNNDDDELAAIRQKPTVDLTREDFIKLGFDARSPTDAKAHISTAEPDYLSSLGPRPPSPSNAWMTEYFNSPGVHAQKVEAYRVGRRSQRQWDQAKREREEKAEEDAEDARRRAAFKTSMEQKEEEKAARRVSVSWSSDDNAAKKPNAGYNDW